MDAVIFDFDGLMVDTEWPAYQAWSQIYSRHDAKLELSVWVKAVGTWMGFDAAHHLQTLVGRELDRDALFAEKEQIKAEICMTQPFMAGVEDRLAEIEALGVKKAVVSTSDSDWVLGHLNRLGRATFFDTVVTRDMVTNFKPHPEPYLTAALRLGVSPERCLVFEDSINGVKAAKAASMICVAVPNQVTKALDFSAADRVVESLAHVTIKELMSS